MIEFPISGVETYWWLPAVVAFGISLFTSTGGLSGAFLILPFQVSILGFTSPAVTPTNLVYNIAAIPGGVYRFYREGRMIWPLMWTMTLGTIPGMVIGAIVRLNYLPDPTAFKFFVGLVLLYISGQLGFKTFKKTDEKSQLEKAFKDMKVESEAFSLKDISYNYGNKTYSVPTGYLFIMSFGVRIIGGIYGIGGGALLVPILVAVYSLPVYTIAGAALCSTFLCSIAGAIIYLVISALLSESGTAIAPDWLLGFMFGIGGFLGIYTGARLQKYLPAKVIRIILTVSLMSIALRYIYGFLYESISAPELYQSNRFF